MQRKLGWSFVIGFLFINAVGVGVALWRWEHYLARRGADPILQEAPSDQNGLQGRQPIRWVWNAPVVAPALVGKSPDTPPVTFQPDIAGEFRWASDRVLEFLPREPWPAARRFRVLLHASLETPGGRLLTQRHEGVVRGVDFDLILVQPQALDVDQTLRTFLRFNAAVDAERLRRNLDLVDADGKTVGFRIAETPVPNEVLLISGIGFSAPLQLTLRAGLDSRHNENCGLRLARTVSLTPPQRFNLVGVESQQPTFGPGFIDLAFSSEVDLSKITGAIEIEPNVKASLGTGEWWRSGVLRISGDFTPGSKVTLHLHSHLAGSNGQTLGKELSIPVLIPHRQPGLRFAHPGGNLLNASGARRVRIETENEGAISLSLRRVHDNNLIAYLAADARDNPWSYLPEADDGLAAPLWEKKLDLPASGPLDLDLAEPLASAGQGVYRLSVEGRNSRQTISRLLTVGDTGLLVRRQGADELLVWALGLADAQPASGLRVTLWSNTRQLLAEGTTDASGMVRLSPRALAKEEDFFAILAQGSGRLGLLTLTRTTDFPADTPLRLFLDQGTEGFVHTDRGIYRPGETLHAHAIVRAPNFTLPGTFPVRWTLRGPDGLVRWSALRELSDVGTTEVSTTFSESWPSGPYNLTLSLPGEEAPAIGSTTILVESFVPPQVVVDVSCPDGERFVGPNFLADVAARLLYGAPAAAHPCAGQLTLVPEEFRSSELPTHTFSDDRKPEFSRQTFALGSGQTDAQGRASFQIGIPGNLNPPSAIRAVVGVTVREFSGRAANAFLSRRVDVQPYYLGLSLAPAGDAAIDVDVAARLPDDTPLRGERTVQVILYRVNWQTGYRLDARGRYTWVSEEVAVEEGATELRLFDGRGRIRLAAAPDAIYRVAVEDADNRVSAARRVALGRGGAEPGRADRVALSFDRDQANLGDTVRLRLRSPFAGRALVTVEDRDLLYVREVLLEGRETEIALDIPETKHPCLWVRAVVVRPLPGGGQQPVVRADGAALLRIDRSAHSLPLDITAPDRILPSRDARILLRGEPGAEVVLAGVDEGILLLTDFVSPDPFAWFTAPRRARSLQFDVFDSLMPELGDLLRPGDAEMGGGMDALIVNRLNPIDAKRFRPLALWSGARRIPESGELTIDLPIPEFSGEIRWMAVQASSRGVGSAQATSKVGRDVVTQQSLPLFLAPGDRSVWTLRIHNRGSDSAELRVAATTEGPLQIIPAHEPVLRLAPGEVRLVTGVVEAGAATGVARLRAAFSLGDDAWEDMIELAVRPVEPFTSRSWRATLEPGSSMTLPPRAGWLPGAVRTLRVDSMPSAQLDAAVSFLLQYPYGCVEQTVSAAFAALVLPERIPAAQRGGAEFVQAGILSLFAKQRPGGEFGYWSNTDDASPVGTFHALEFLIEARRAGFEIDPERLRAGLDWTRDWLNRGRWRIDKQGRADNLLLASSALVLAKAGELDPGWAQRLLERRDDLHGPARIAAADALAEAGHRPLAAEMLRGLDAMNTGEGWFTTVVSNANLLRVLLKIDPRDGRIPPLVSRVLSARDATGRWSGSFENAAVLRALAAYHRAYPGSDSLLNVSGLPIEQPLVADALTLRNDGDRAVYVEDRIQGIPASPLPMESAFHIECRLLRADGALLEGPASSGELLVLHLRLRGLPRPSEYLVIDQRLPAGLEPLPDSRQLDVLSQLSFDPGIKPHRPRHLEIRDDRILVFPHRIDTPDYHVLLLLRAVSPGEYVFPATFAQEMYNESFASRGSESRITIMP